MGNRIENALKEYFAKNWKGKEAAFYATDIEEARRKSGGDR